MTQPCQTIDAGLCPLCQQSNQCAMVAGDATKPCWCLGLTFSQALLDQVPLALKDQACICRNCALGATQPD